MSSNQIEFCSGKEFLSISGFVPSLALAFAVAEHLESTREVNDDEIVNMIGRSTCNRSEDQSLRSLIPMSHSGHQVSNMASHFSGQQGQIDLFTNHMWTPTVELETIRDMHFGTIIPKLQSLLPQAAVHPFTRAPDLSNDGNVYSETYFKLLLISLSNNFAGLDDSTMEFILDYVQTRFETNQVSRFMTTLRAPASAAFAENLLHCAVHANAAVVVDFLLSQENLGLGVNKNFCSCFEQRSTFVCLAAKHHHVAVLKILLKHGADLNRIRETNGASSALWQATIECHTNHRTDTAREATLSILLEAGATGLEQVLEHMFTYTPVNHLHYGDKMIEPIMSHGTHNLYHQWARTGLLQSAIIRLPCEASERIANIMFELEVDVNVRKPVGQSRFLALCSKAKVKTVIDAAADTGNLRLVQIFCDNGASITEETLELAIESANFELVCYLIHQGAGVNRNRRLSLHAVDRIHSGGPDFVRLLQQSDDLAHVLEKELYCAKLYSASENGDMDLVKSLLESSILNTKTLDEDDSSREDQPRKVFGRAIAKALRAEQVEVAFALINAGANPDIRDEDGSVPLNLALQLKHSELVRALIEADVNREPHPDMGRGHMGTLEIAIQWGEHAIVEDLLFAGLVNDTTGDRGKANALKFAVEVRNYFWARYLLEAGTDVNFPLDYVPRLHFPNQDDPFWMTPLAAAAGNGDVDMIQLLLAFGADPADPSALWGASQHSRSTMLVLLDEIARQHPLGKKNLGTVVLRKAIRQGEVELAKLLLDFKADFRSYVRENRQSIADAPLAVAIKADVATKSEMINLLLEASADPDMIVERPVKGYLAPQQTALLYAINVGDITIVRLLIQRGARVNFPATRGVKRTPLQQACEAGSFEIVRLLLENGASVNAPPAFRGGATALQLAAIGGYVGIAELLLDNHADVNGAAAKVDGRSAIEGAAEHGRLDMVDFLLRHNAVLDPCGLGSECRAIKLAERQGHFAIARFLKSCIYDYPTINTTVNHVHDGSAEQSLAPPPARSIDHQAGRPICDECDLSFKNSSSLARHVRTKHPVLSADGDSEYQCNYCPRSFNRKDTLQRHESTHTKDGRVPCPECGADLSRKDYLNIYHLDANGRCKMARATEQVSSRALAEDGDVSMEESVEV